MTYGTPSTIDLYTGTFAADLPNITGMFFDCGPDLLHAGQRRQPLLPLLHSAEPHRRQRPVCRRDRHQPHVAWHPSAWRACSCPDRRSTSRTRPTGTCTRSLDAAGAVSGTAARSTARIDWRARGLFVRSGLLPNVPPVAVAAFTGCVLNVCSFDGTGSTDSDGTIVSYLWDFGDGATGHRHRAVTPLSARAATTIATLTVTDDRGGSGRTRWTHRRATPPTRRRRPPSRAAASTATCTLDASGSSDPDGTITSYAWDFGDGTDGRPARPDAHLRAAGTYTVSLVVTDDDAADSPAVDHDVSPADPPASAIGVPRVGHGVDHVSDPAGHRARVGAGWRRPAAVRHVQHRHVGLDAAGRLDPGGQPHSPARTPRRCSTARSPPPPMPARSRPSSTPPPPRPSSPLLAYSGTAANPIQVVRIGRGDRQPGGAHHTRRDRADRRLVGGLLLGRQVLGHHRLDPARPADRARRSRRHRRRARHVRRLRPRRVRARGPSGGSTATADSSSAKATMWSVVLKAANAPEPGAGRRVHDQLHPPHLHGGRLRRRSIRTAPWRPTPGTSVTAAPTRAPRPCTRLIAAARTRSAYVVTDNQGLASTAVTHDVDRRPPHRQSPSATAATFSGNAVTNRVTIPASVQAGDAHAAVRHDEQLDAVATRRRAGPPPAPSSPAPTRGPCSTRRSRHGTGRVEGAVHHVRRSDQGRPDLLAYSDVRRSVRHGRSAAETVNRSTHTTPGATVPPTVVGGLLLGRPVVDHQLDRSGGAGATKHLDRDQPGRIVPGNRPGSASAAGPSAGLTATADQPTAKATMWSVVIKAAS